MTSSLVSGRVKTPRFNGTFAVEHKKPWLLEPVYMMSNTKHQNNMPSQLSFYQRESTTTSTNPLVRLQ